MDARREPDFSLSWKRVLLVSLVLRHTSCFDGRVLPQMTGDEGNGDCELLGGKGPGEARLDRGGPKTGPRQRNFPGRGRGGPTWGRRAPWGLLQGAPDAVCPALPSSLVTPHSLPPWWSAATLCESYLLPPGLEGWSTDQLVCGCPHGPQSLNLQLSSRSSLYQGARGCKHPMWGSEGTG